MSCCYNITFSVFWVSQGSVTTLIRWGGWSSKRHIYRSFRNLTVKTALKSVDFCRDYKQKEVGSFYGPCVVLFTYLVKFWNLNNMICSADDTVGVCHIQKKKTCYFTSNYPHFHAMIFFLNLKRIGLYFSEPLCWNWYSSANKHYFCAKITVCCSNNSKHNFAQNDFHCATFTL